MKITLPEKRIKKSEKLMQGRWQAWMIDVVTGRSEKIHEEDFYSYKKNTTPTEYCNDLALLNAGGSVDIGIKYIALSTKAAVPSKTSTLELEKFREAYSFRTNTGNKCIIEATFGNTMSTEETTITSNVTSKKIFEITDRTGYSIGDAVAVGPEQEPREITNLVAGTGTLAIITLNKELKNLPENGWSFNQQIGRIHGVYGATATSTLNTGKGISIAQLRTVKPSTKILFCRLEIEYLGS